MKTMDLTVKNLSKQFVDFKLDNISFELPRGSVMGLIGPNGSGKTTTIKLILNMLKKNQGKIEILGYDNIKEEQIANDWKFKQIVIPFDEKKGIYCTLGYEVIFERKK